SEDKVVDTINQFRRGLDVNDFKEKSVKEALKKDNFSTEEVVNIINEQGKEQKSRTNEMGKYQKSDECGRGGNDD
ncbi:21118_t:CDS:2, partial [Rhizophagus irregularis]